MIKKIFSGIGIGVLILFGVLYFIGNKAADDAVSYNDKIITMDEQTISAFENMDRLFEEGGSTDLEKKRLDIVVLVKKNTDHLKAMSLPKLGDEGFRDSIFQMFDLYKKWAEKDYKELVDIYSQKNPSKANLAKADQIYTQMENEEGPLLNKIKKAQEAFSKKYFFELK